MRLPGFENVRPPRPTRYDETVARAIAERLIREIDPDLQSGDEEGFYWTKAELPDRTWELQQAIMADVHPHALIRFCRKKFRATDWHWEGISENCRHYAPIAIQEEVAKAVKGWMERYEVKV